MTVFYFILTLSLHGIASAFTICADNATNVQPICKRTGELAELKCHHHHCDGVYVFQHFNQSTQRWDIIQEGSYNYTIPAVEFDDGGSYRCWKRCHNKRQSAHCYLGVTVTSGIEFPQAIINTSCSGTCNATANPRPEVSALIRAEDCPYTISYANINSYTREVTVTIPHVTAKCREAIISCHACHVTKNTTLHITEGTFPTTYETPPTTSDYSPTTTTTTTTTTIGPTNHPTDVGNAAGSTRSTGLVKITFIAILLIYFTSC